MNGYEKDGFVGSVVENLEGDPILALVAYKGEGTKLEVPSHLDSGPVIELRGTFAGNETVEEVTLPEGMTTIGIEAFRGCTSLKKVTFSSTITEVALHAFSGCSQLEELDIPQPETLYICYAKVFDKGRYPWTEEGFLLFGSVLFAYSGTHKVVRVPEGVKTIRSRAFKHSSVEEVIFPSTVELLEEFSLYECRAVEKVTFTAPSSLKHIKQYAFDCEKLQQIDLPPSLERIEQGAFWKCSNLAHVTLSPDTVVEKEAFRFASRETAYLSYLPPNVVASCTDLEQSRYYLFHFGRLKKRTPEERVELQEGMARFLREVDCCIPDDSHDVKQGVLFLKSIFTQRTVKEVAQFFDWGLTLTLAQFETYLNHSIKAGKTTITAYLLEQKKKCYTEKEIEDYETRKDRVEQGLVIPTLEELSRKWNLSRRKDEANVVEVLGYRGGSGQEILPSCTEDGVKISMVSPRPYASSGEKPPYGDLAFLEMGAGIGLEDRTFMGAGLEEIRLPKDLKVIPTRCFYYTPSLREIALPEGLTEIEERGLSETGIEEIVLPNSLETLGHTALDGCLSLKKVVFRGSLEILRLPPSDTPDGEGYFANCPLLQFVGVEGGENQLERLREEGIVCEN